MSTRAGPLAGTRIVMMGGLGPGPFCGMLLGDLGADVIRVDRTSDVDVDRAELVDRVVRRSQRSIAVDLKDRRGAELVRRLVADADAFVDVAVAMVDGVAALMGVFYGLFAEGTWSDRRGANVLDGAAHYYRTYETADGGHMAVGAMEPKFYASLCARLGVDVPRGSSPDDWSRHAEVLAARFRERTRAEWESVLLGTETCATPVLGLAEAPDHPHHRARGTFVEIDGVLQPAPAPRFSRTAAPRPTPPALPGAHTHAILGDLALDPTAPDIAAVTRQR